MSVKIYDPALQSFKKVSAKIKLNSNWIEESPKVYRYNYGIWSDTTDSSETPNYSTVHNDCIYKWGYYNLGKESNAAKLREAYMRFVNAYIYLDQYSSVKYNKYGSSDVISYSNVTGTYTYNGNSYPALRVYLSDLSLNNTAVNLAFSAFEMDNPALIPKWCFCEDSSGERYMLRSNVNNFLSSNINYSLLPYYPVSQRDTYKSYLESSFGKINQKIKQYYGIEFVERGYYQNNKYYTRKQKAQVAKCIHDWLVYHNYYGTSTTPLNGNQEIWPAMSDKIANPVCIGYAKAFAYCCWRWGITCIICYGHARENHAWNMYTCEPYTIHEVSIINSSIWQDIDVTWDDTSMTLSNYCSWKYFNVTTQWLYNFASHIRTFFGVTEYTNAGGSTITADNGMTKSLPVESGSTKLFWKDDTVYSDENGSYVYAGFENIAE